MIQDPIYHGDAEARFKKILLRFWGMGFFSFSASPRLFGEWFLTGEAS